VIATGVWAVGVSFNSLQVLVRAGGGTSETDSIQIPGRVGRIDPDTGKPCGLLIDVMDEFDSGCLANSRKRRQAYAKQGWMQYNPDGTLWATRGKHATV